MQMLALRRGITFVLIALSVVLVGIAVVNLFGTGPDTDTLALLVASGSALFSAISSEASLEQAAAAREQVESMQQPSVTASFDFQDPIFLKFVVANMGNAPALDVAVVFDDPVPEGHGGIALGYSDPPIGFLAPDQRIAQLFGSGNELQRAGKLTEYRATISYRSLAGKEYSLAVTYELSYLKTALLPHKTVEHQLGEIAKAVKSLSGK